MAKDQDAPRRGFLARLFGGDGLREEEAPPPRREPHFSRLPMHRPAASYLRSFDAAKNDRLLSGFVSFSRPLNDVLREQLEPLRARSRDIAKNNDHMRGFLRLVKANVVGSTGIRLQSRARDPNGSQDETGNRIVEGAWRRFGRRLNFTLDGRLSLIEAQRLYIETIARDGECFVQLVPGARNTAFRFGVRFVPAELVPVHLNEDLSNGRRIRLGVELDRFDRPTAYYVATAHPHGDFLDARSGRKYERVPAARMVHGFLSEDAGQIRGVPWAVSAIRRLKMLGGYEEAELVAARVASAKSGFFTRVSESGEYAQADEVTEDGDFIQEAEPGHYEILPEGYDFRSFDPQHPTQQFGDFVKALLRGVSAGLGTSYNSLANDLEGVNFSSLRHGRLEEIEVYRELQTFVIESFLEPIYRAWLAHSLDFGFLEPLPPRRFDKFSEGAVFRGRGWPWVDPVKEGQAKRLEFDMGVISLSEIAAEKGRDLEEVFRQRQADEELAATYGVDLPSAVGAVTSAAPAGTNGQGGQNGEDDEDD